MPLVALVLVLGGGCSARPGAKPTAAAGDAAVVAPVPAVAAPAPAAAAAAPATAPVADAKPRLHLQLRSTPPGADVAVDGRPAGRTPTMAEVDDDGREHEFTFVLAGYALERYRTRVVQAGVIHASMHAIPAPVDAAPR
jgi:hypothetical protein